MRRYPFRASFSSLQVFRAIKVFYIKQVFYKNHLLEERISVSPRKILVYKPDAQPSCRRESVIILCLLVAVQVDHRLTWFPIFISPSSGYIL